MNNPLSYQATEYDCGPTALRNAVSYLFAREEIPPEIIKYIHLYGMDSHSQDGEPCKNGTSAFAMVFLANWLNRYGEMKKWPIQCQPLAREQIYIGQSSSIVAALQQGGVAVVRVVLESGHYILLTGVRDEYIEAFDPYYDTEPFEDPRIQVVDGQPERLNRLIRWDVLNGEGEGDYHLGAKDKRECVLFFNTKTRIDGGQAEYSI